MQTCKFPAPASNSGVHLPVIQDDSMSRGVRSGPGLSSFHRGTSLGLPLESKVGVGTVGFASHRKAVLAGAGTHAFLRSEPSVLAVGPRFPYWCSLAVRLTCRAVPAILRLPTRSVVCSFFDRKNIKAFGYTMISEGFES